MFRAICHLLLLVQSFSKVTTLTITLDEKTNWRYLSKFATDQGKAYWTARVKFMKPINSTDAVTLSVASYMDNKWDDALSTSNCEDKHHYAQRKKELAVPPNGDWSDLISSTWVLSTSSQPHFWFLSISNCQVTSKQKLKVEISMINSDGSHFSLEQRGLVYMYPLTLVIFLVVLSQNLMKLYRKFLKTDDLETHLLILNIAIALEFFGVIFQVVHLWVYHYNGYGIAFFEFVYQSLAIMSSLTVTILFILMASGWTLNYREFPEAEMFVPVSLLVIMLNLLIVGIGKVTDDAYYKFSEYEGVTGYLVVVIRIGFWGWFMYLVSSLYGDGLKKTSGFAINFGILGSGYLLAQPILLIFSWVFATYWRSCIVAVGGILVQIFVFAFLAHLFSERSSYYKVSSMSDSVLPGKMS